MNPPLTIFRWGYWGWGNATRELVQAADAIEVARGFAPPLFVDARISRSVRAVGFRGDAFGKATGDGRYLWMDGLGNLGVLQRTGGCRIKTPTDAGKLLDLAVTKAAEDRHVIFFCSCEIPLCNGQECHRVEVGRLVLAEARKRKQALTVEEWPGGTPTPVTVPVTAEVMKKVRSGLKSVPLGKTLPPAARLGLPWGTASELKNRLDSLTILTGPAHFSPRGWVLPVLGMPQSSQLPGATTSYRAAHSYEPTTA